MDNTKWETFVNILENNGRFNVTYPKDLTLFELDLWEKFRTDEPISYTSSTYGFSHSSYKRKSKKINKSKRRTKSRKTKKGKRKYTKKY
jgi:hypothetical protein